MDDPQAYATATELLRSFIESQDIPGNPPDLSTFVGPPPVVD